MLFVLFEVSDVDVAVGVYLISKAMLFVVMELPFVDLSVLIDGNTYTSDATVPTPCFFCSLISPK